MRKLQVDRPIDLSNLINQNAHDYVVIYIYIYI